ncbi:hypothetical protein G6673_01100 [Polynucleobacter paneuropaeus]|nr:hypothetical protein [Polynucleobacter paneuropaeus]MBT8531170.1 hypothetical protein [Polynucleobacter paneuropaeus]MBT8602273.1 hypothetical protein [Polynucleobacter paneuropaeus]QWD41354.1 hypothetical protein G6668_03340 [Polynucleobacter paneuropaeus]
MKLYIALLMFVPTLSFAQTTYYSDANGMPIGTAQKSGNTTYYSNANGMPTGTAQNVGNTTYYSNANGMPIGTAQQPIQQQQFQQAPLNAPTSPTFPTSPLFPSSPIGR